MTPNKPSEGSLRLARSFAIPGTEDTFFDRIALALDAARAEGRAEALRDAIEMVDATALLYEQSHGRLSVPAAAVRLVNSGLRECLRVEAWRVPPVKEGPR